MRTDKSATINTPIVIPLLRGLPVKGSPSFEGGQAPIGPVSTELLLEGIGEGMVPRDSVVCELGGSQWQPITRVPPFSTALEESRAQRDDTASGVFDDPDEKTIADAPPVPTTQRPSGSDQRDFDDPEEKTIVDLVPLKPSSPPPKR